MAYDNILAQRVRGVASPIPGLQEKKMFGGLGFILNGNMACGIIGDDLVVRVNPAEYPQMVVRPHARPFDSYGRPMKGWVLVAPAGVENDETLAEWIEQGVAFAASLPPK